MKYKITYALTNGSGEITFEGTEQEFRDLIEKLRNLGCQNIAYEEVQEPKEEDPCDRCNKYYCYGCIYAENELND